MNRQTFYRNLRKYAHYFNWSYDKNNKNIRGKVKNKYKKQIVENSGYYEDGGSVDVLNFVVCPITSINLVRDNIWYGSAYWAAINDLDMDNEESAVIAQAADNVDGCKQSVRKTLIKILKPKRIQRVIESS